MGIIGVPDTVRATGLVPVDEARPRAHCIIAVGQGVIAAGGAHLGTERAVGKVGARHALAVPIGRLDHPPTHAIGVGDGVTRGFDGLGAIPFAGRTTSSTGDVEPNTK